VADPPHARLPATRWLSRLAAAPWPLELNARQPTTLCAWCGRRWAARFEQLAPCFSAYARAGMPGFKKNDHRKLPAALEARVRQRWAASFKEFGYS